MEFYANEGKDELIQATGKINVSANDKMKENAEEKM